MRPAGRGSHLPAPPQRSALVVAPRDLCIEEQRRPTGPAWRAGAGLAIGAAGSALGAGQRAHRKRRRHPRPLVSLAAEGEEDGSVAVQDAEMAEQAEEQGSVQAMNREETAWLVQLRRCYHKRDLDQVSRIVMAMGGSRHADEMHCAIAQEAVTSTPQYFAALLRKLRKAKHSPHHAVDLYHMVEAWWRNTCPDTYMWNEVLYSLAIAGEYEEAEALLTEMERGDDPRLCAPSRANYTCVQWGAAEVKGLNEAMSLIQRAQFNGKEPSSVSYFVAFVAAVREGDLEMGKRWFLKVEDSVRAQGWSNEKCVYLYNVLMGGYLKARRLKDMYALVGTLRWRDMRPNFVSFVLLMTASMERSSYGTQECRQILRIMQQMGVSPQTCNYNVLIRGYGVTGQLTNALRVANKMREAGIAWDSWTYLRLIAAVITAGQVELSLRLLAKMRRDGVCPQRQHYTIAFVGLARAGFHEDAGRVFRRLCSLGGLANIESYNTMLSIHVKRGDMDSALDLFDKMEDVGLEPDVMTYRVLLEGHLFQQEWDKALALHGPLVALRQKLQRMKADTSLTQAARKQAALALDEPENHQIWWKAFHFLIDAATYAGLWLRSVRLVEETVELGLPVDPYKHARMLRECKASVRNSQGFGVPRDPETKAAQAKWVETLPAVIRDMRHGSIAQGRALSLASTKISYEQEEATRWPGAERAHEQAQNKEETNTLAAPAHLLCATFSPDWLDADRPGPVGGSSVLGQCLDKQQILPADAYRVVHDFYHATVFRRGIVSMRHQPGTRIIVSTALLDADELSKLFMTFGSPGETPGLCYVFTRCAALQLDLLLGLMAVAAEHPDQVLLLRSQSDERQFSALAAECRERGDRPLSYCLASTLVGLPPAVLINSQVMVADAVDLEGSSPDDFEDNLRALVAESFKVPEAGSEAEDDDDEEDDGREELSARGKSATAMAWVSWLRSQCLERVLRCQGSKVRLDGSRQAPVLTQADVFRARVLDNGQVAVDLWLDEEDGVTSFGDPTTKLRGKPRRLGKLRM